MGQLTQTAGPAKDVLGVGTTAVVADKGRFNIEDIEACGKAGMVPCVPRLQRGPSAKAGLFRKDEFSHDAAGDRFVCPAGRRLHPCASPFPRGIGKISHTDKLACDGCAIRSRCTSGRFRTVCRMENEAVLDRVQARLAGRPDVLGRGRRAFRRGRRRETAEHPFGTVKHRMNQGTFLMRGLEKVRPSSA